MLLLTIFALAAIVVIATWHVLSQPQISMTFRPGPPLPQRHRALLRIPVLPPVRTGNTAPMPTGRLCRTWTTPDERRTRSYLRVG